jgi:hypothetical protein
VADLITLAQWTARTGRTLSATKETQVEALITDASALVVDVVNDATTTDAWDAASVGTVPASIVPVVVSMVRRGFDNPNGHTGESVGAYSYSGASTSGLFATRDEVKAIRKAAGLAGVASLHLESDGLYGYPYLGDHWLDGAL